MEPETYTYIVVLAFIVSAFDAFAIGANDVANSFATSVASKSIKLWQACVIACFAEFLGALLLGSGVAETIRKGIVDLGMFEQPELLMVGMFTANIGSCSVVLGATFIGLPVSTTHAVVGGVIGTGIACYGMDAVIWGWTSSGKGVGVIVASWFISPFFAGTLGALFYRFTTWAVMKREDSFKAARHFVPFYFFFTSGTILFYFAYKGAPIVKSWELEPWEVSLIALLPALVIGAFSYFYMIPSVIIPWVEEHYEDKAQHRVAAIGETKPTELSEITVDGKQIEKEATQLTVDQRGVSSSLATSGKKIVVEEPEKSCLESFKEFLMAPYYQDVVSLDTDVHIQLHSEAIKYNERTEQVFSFLQVVTATCASFSHGANDLANALSPMATVYIIWLSGDFPDKKFEIPFWQIAYCAFAVDVGLWLCGWRIMRELGNNLTYHSPSRGFNMELAAMFTVLTASRLGIPVSTTHCITGATAGVAIAEGQTGTFNWPKFAKICLGWVFTVPIGALVSGCFCAMLIYSPTKVNVLVVNATA